MLGLHVFSKGEEEQPMNSTNHYESSSKVLNIIIVLRSLADTDNTDYDSTINKHRR